MNKDFDVIVIGCGPAGSSAAEHAALNGASVLVLERKKVIGEPVACGEFMPLTEELRTMLPLADDLDGIFDIPHHLISRRMDIFRMYSPSGRSWDIPFQGYTTDRDRFDKHLADKARIAGAEIITGSLVVDVKGGVVRTKDQEFRSKVVIGADGPISKVGEKLGLPSNRDMYPAVTTMAEGDFEPIMEMHFGSIAPGAYAWVLPKKNGANIGIGVAPRWANGKITDQLDAFIASRGLTVRSGSIGKLVPSKGPIKRTYAENGLVVGDAAGHVMAVNGGGIPIAMICGRSAGIAAAKHVTEGAPLSSYEASWRRQVYRPLHTAVRRKC